MILFMLRLEAERPALQHSERRLKRDDAQKKPTSREIRRMADAPRFSRMTSGLRHSMPQSRFVG
jgi:hypothetical protein